MAFFKRWRENRERRETEVRAFVQAEYQRLTDAGVDPDDAADQAIERARLSFADFFTFLPQILELLRMLRDLFRPATPPTP